MPAGRPSIWDKRITRFHVSTNPDGRENFWRCNYATRRGWINVNPYGFIRDCTKKLTKLPYPFATLSRADLRQVRQSLAAGVEQCNRSYYSNCAFDGAYYAKHKLQLLKSRIL